MTQGIIVAPPSNSNECKKFNTLRKNVFLLFGSKVNNWNIPLCKGAGPSGNFSSGFRSKRLGSLAVPFPNRCWSVCILVRKTFKKWSNWNWAVLWIKKVSHMEDFFKSDFKLHIIYYFIFKISVTGHVRFMVSGHLRKPFSHQFDARILKIGM